jgi:hypothetical protein
VGATSIIGRRVFHRWHLTDVQRIDRLRKPKRQPQPVWFRPF